MLWSLDCSSLDCGTFESQTLPNFTGSTKFNGMVTLNNQFVQTDNFMEFKSIKGGHVSLCKVLHPASVQKYK